MNVVSQKFVKVVSMQWKIKRDILNTATCVLGLGLVVFGGTACHMNPHSESGAVGPPLDSGVLCAPDACPEGLSDAVVVDPSDLVGQSSSSTISEEDLGHSASGRILDGHEVSNAMAERSNLYVDQLRNETIEQTLDSLYMFSEVSFLKAMGSDGIILSGDSNNEILWVLRSRRYRKLLDELQGAKKKGELRGFLVQISRRVDASLEKHHEIQGKIEQSKNAPDYDFFQTYDSLIGPQAVFPIDLKAGVLPVTLSGIRQTLETVSHLLGESESLDALPVLLEVARFDAGQRSGVADGNGRAASIFILADAIDRVLMGGDRSASGQESDAVIMAYRDWRRSQSWDGLEREVIATQPFDADPRQRSYDLPAALYGQDDGAALSDGVVDVLLPLPRYLDKTINIDPDRSSPGLTEEDAQAVIDWGGRLSEKLGQ